MGWRGRHPRLRVAVEGALQGRSADRGERRLVAVSWGNEPPGGVQTWPSGLYRRHQRPEPHDIENPPEIVGEGSQAELATNLF